MKKRKILSILLALAMLMSLMPSLAIPAQAMSTSWADNASTGADIPKANGSGVYELDSGADLAWFANQVNSGADTDIEGAVTAAISLSDYYWVPIGTEAHPFIGKLNGAGGDISGMRINVTIQSGVLSTVYNGLFGYTNGAVIQNVTLKNPNISCAHVNSADNGYTYTGALAGWTKSTTITNCSAVDDESDNPYLESLDGKGSLGGLVGYAETSTIASCSSSIDVKSAIKEGNCGGLVGTMDGGSLTSSYATGIVSSNDSAKPAENSGGLVGETLGAPSISVCYALGSVVRYFINGGGLVGALSAGATVKNCHAYGYVNCDWSRSFTVSYAGGLIGRLNGTGVTYCYASGTASVGSGLTGGAGGFAGYYAGGSALNTNYLYYNNTDNAKAEGEATTASGLNGCASTALTCNGSGAVLTSLNTENLIGSAAVWAQDDAYNHKYIYLKPLEATYSYVAPTAYTVSGALTFCGVPLSGKTVTLTNTTTEAETTDTTDSSGAYSFSNVVKGAYTVSVAAASGYFDATSCELTVTDANVTQNIAPTKLTSSPDYFISAASDGKVSLNGTAYNTLTLALASINTASPKIHFGGIDGSAAKLAATAYSTDCELISGTYTGKVDFSGSDDYYELTVPSGATVAFSGVELTNTANTSKALYVSGTFSMTDGSIEVSGNNSSCIDVSNVGSATINSGTVSSNSNSGSAGIRNFGRLTIKGTAEITGNSTGVGVFDNGSVTISGGSIECPGGGGSALLCSGKATVTMTGGTVKSTNKGENRSYGILAYDSSKINISGGTVSAASEAGASEAIYYSDSTGNHGTVTISDKAIISAAYLAIYCNTQYSQGVEVAKISGGTISGNYGVENRGSGLMTISGGTISSSFASVINDTDGTIDITGGDITCTGMCGVVLQGGTINISGGKISNTNAQGFAVGAKADEISGVLNISGKAEITSASPYTYFSFTTGAAATVNLFGTKKIHNDVRNYMMVAASGELSQGVYKITSANYTNAKLIAADAVLFKAPHALDFGAWTSDASRKNVLGSTNGAALSTLDNTDIYVLYVPIPSGKSKFEDTEEDADEIGGTLRWARVEQTETVSGYKIYWGSSSTKKLSGQSSAIYTVESGNSSNLQQDIPQNTKIPNGAKYLLIYSYGIYGESVSCLAVSLGAKVGTPTVTTQAVTTIDKTSAVGHGSITDLGTTNPTQYGVVWSTNTNPEVGLTTKTEQGERSTQGEFSSEIKGLSADTTYYVRAYATNSKGTAYGEEVTFKTSGDSVIYVAPAPVNTIVEVDGKKQDAGTSSSATSGGKTVTTIKVDDTKLDKLLESSGNKPTVTLPSTAGSNVTVGELNGQTVKNMEKKEAVLEIKTETVTYTLPAAQIDIDSVSSQIGSQVELKDIKVSVKIAEPSADTAKIVADTASKGNYQVVVKPVEFEITCTSGTKTVEVPKFNGYVERTVAIPDGVDPSKITTGIVLNADGSFSHVPTVVVKIDGKYYAKINSLTNSTYSVIYNPVTFTDAANHWAKAAINDMGSRMVVTGMGDGSYQPDRSITRAEFAAIAVRAMGLRQGTTESAFGDVSASDWFNGYVDKATEYGLITGYDSTSYGPNDTITREQAMAIIARAMKITGLSVSLTDSEVSSLLANYTDGASVSSYARAGAAACLKAGIVTGSSTTTLSPKSYVTRAEVAVMVQRLLQKSGLI